MHMHESIGRLLLDCIGTRRTRSGGRQMTPHQLAKIAAVSLVFDGWIIYAVRAIWRAMVQP